MNQAKKLALILLLLETSRLNLQHRRLRIAKRKLSVGKKGEPAAKRRRISVSSSDAGDISSTQDDASFTTSSEDEYDSEESGLDDLDELFSSSDSECSSLSDVDSCTSTSETEVLRNVENGLDADSADFDLLNDVKLETCDSFDIKPDPESLFDIKVENSVINGGHNLHTQIKEEPLQIALSSNDDLSID